MAAVHPRPAPARPGPRAATLARVLALVALAVSASLLGPRPAAAHPAQDPGATVTFGTEGSTTTVPGSTTAPTTVAGPSTTAAAPATGSGSTRVADENRKIWAVVGGLVFVAVALSLLTIRYWRKTRPVAVEVHPMAPSEAALAVALTSTPTSDDAVATPAPAPAEADAVAPDAAEPDSVDEAEPATQALDAVDVPATDADPEVAAVAPAAGAVAIVAAAAIADPVEDTGPETAPVPVVDVPDAEPATARRAVAGADHAAADEAWRPRATGEVEQVVVAPAARPNRLSPEQRAALFAKRPPSQP